MSPTETRSAENRHAASSRGFLYGFYICGIRASRHGRGDRREGERNQEVVKVVRGSYGNYGTTRHVRIFGNPVAEETGDFTGGCFRVNCDIAGHPPHSQCLRISCVDRHLLLSGMEGLKRCKNSLKTESR